MFTKYILHINFVYDWSNSCLVFRYLTFYSIKDVLIFYGLKSNPNLFTVQISKKDHSK